MFCFVDHAELSKRYTNSLFKFYLFVCFMVFNATFSNISVISLFKSVLLVEKTTDLSQVTDKLYHLMLYTSPCSRFELTTSVVIGTDCIGSCKSNHDSPYLSFKYVCHEPNYLPCVLQKCVRRFHQPTNKTILIINGT